MTVSRPSLQISLFCREGVAGAGIDLQAVPLAPGGECGGVDYGAYGDLPLGAEAAFGLIRDLLPVLEAGGQAVGVRHEAQDRRIVLFQMPGDAEDLDGAAGVGVGGGHGARSWSAGLVHGAG